MDLTNKNFENLRNPIKTHLEIYTRNFFSRRMFWLKPNYLSLINFLGFAIAGIILIISPTYIWLSAILLFIAGMSDLFDGIVARARNQTSSKGLFIDGVADRFGELIFLLFLYLSNLVNREIIVLIAIGGLLINYLQLHYLQTGGKFRPTLFEKPERNVYFIMFCLFWNFEVLQPLLTQSLSLVALLLLFSIIQILNRVRINEFSRPTNPFQETYEEDYITDEGGGELIAS